MVLTQDVIREAEEIYDQVPFENLEKHGFSKKFDYSFIYSYPPVRSLSKIEENALFNKGQYSHLKREINLYIHIPYCKSICSYCYFAHVLDKPNAVVTKSRYIDLLIKEFELYVQKIGFTPEITSIHIGGGTPTVIDISDYERLFRYLAPHIRPNAEITVESSPDSVMENPSIIDALMQLGVNRFNVGLESLDDAGLKYMGRRHNSATGIKVAELLLSKSDNVNADVIYGLPMQTQNHWIEHLKFLMDIGLHSISAYRLRVHPQKAISKVIPDKFPSSDETMKMQIAHGILAKKHGYIRSSSHKYAKDHSKLQVQIEKKRGTDSNQLLSLGCGAYGFINQTFYWNTRKLADYESSIVSGHLPVFIGSELSKDEMMRKDFILSTHTNKGLNINSFLNKYNEDPLEYFQNEIKELRSHNLIDIDEHIKPTEYPGRLFADEISVFLYSNSVKQSLNQQGMKYGMFWEDIK